MKRCDICCGSRVIRLPVRRPVAVASFNADLPPVAVEADWREYPCPECAGKVDQDRVSVLDTHATVRADIEDEEFALHVRETAAHMLVGHLLKGDYIAFEKGPVDRDGITYPIVATLGVVSRGVVASFEDRVKARQHVVATAVAEEAIKQIDNWGSYYGHAEILKRDARSMIGDALRSVLGGWSKVKELAAKAS